MSSNGRPSFAKRQKEQSRQEKQREKAAKRNQRKIDKQNGVTTSTDEQAYDADGNPIPVAEPGVGDAAPPAGTDAPTTG